jgi:predicted metal-dependent hydrolase
MYRTAGEDHQHFLRRRVEGKYSQQRVVTPAKVMILLISDSKLVDNAAVEEFFQRNIAWLHKKNDKMVREREEKLGQELVDCTFKPVTHQFVKDETPGLDHGIDQETDYRMVFDGKTYDLAKEKELQEFLLKSIAKSGQRSIFRKSNETSNKIYQEIMR